MVKEMKVYLIGLPGVGKSTVGNELARKIDSKGKEKLVDEDGFILPQKRNE